MLYPDGSLCIQLLYVILQELPYPQKPIQITM